MPAWENGSLEHLLAELQRVFTEALVAGDEPTAELLLREAMDARVSEGELYNTVIAPALRAVGDLWADGRLSVAEEHLATEIALRVVTLARELFRVERRRPGAVVLMAAVARERHVVGLRMAGSLLGHAGYDVKQLGADVPVHSLAGLVVRHRPVAVGLSATMPAAIVPLLETMELVVRISPTTGLLLGGPAVQDRGLERPGRMVCRRMTDVIGLVDGMAQRAPLN